MYVRLWSLLVWALVGASSIYWGLQLGVRPQVLPPQAAVVQPPDLLQTSLGRLAAGEAAGAPAPAVAAPAPDPAAGRFVLVGVISPPQQGGAGPHAKTHEGVALIAVDGKPPRSYAVGAVVGSGWVLQAVSRRHAQLGPPGQAAQLKLTIPEPAPSASGQIRPVSP